MRLVTRRKPVWLGLLCAAALTPVTVYGTVVFAAFRSIPWTLAYLVMALSAEVGGLLPAFLSGVISVYGVYRFVLVPEGASAHDSATWWKVAAFILTGSFLTYLVRQRSLAMTSLAASEAHYRSVTETASDVIVTIDQTGCILSINPAVQAVFGYAPQEAIGMMLATLVPESHRIPYLDAKSMSNDPAPALPSVPAAPSPYRPALQLTGHRKDGQEMPLEMSFASYASSGRPRFTCFIRDISERQKAQFAVIQSEKLAAVGRLASSIAHEINNPLEAVTNLLYLARHSSDLASAIPYLEDADTELRRASAITAQTLRFHKQSTRPTAVTLDELMIGILTGQHSRLQNSSVATVQRMRARRPVLCFEGEIRQVLRNLIGNALDAMQAGGTLFLRGREGHDWRSGRPGLIVTIADNGTGMSDTTRMKLFDAFYTTKGIGGTGLGLWISKEIIDRHNGRFLVRSSQRPPHAGTVFTVFLPFEAVTRRDPA